MIEYVELETARAASGLRIVVPGAIPSPWSEAVKGLLRLAELPALAVRMSLNKNQKDVQAWTGVDNVPIVLHAGEPARTSWAAITGLVARLAPDTVVPHDPAARAEVMGVLEMIAGEDGIGWNARVAMVEAGFATGGQRGFAPPAAGYLEKRYTHAKHADTVAAARERTAAQLALLDARLAASGGRYFGGSRPNAIDVYAATFLTPFFVVSEQDCPRMHETVRQAFTACAEDFGPLVPESLASHRTRMFAELLGWPIAL